MTDSAIRIAAAQGPVESYTITDLGTFPGGATSLAYGINASGWVVGTADGRTGALHAFLSANGQMQDLGTLGGDISVATSIDAQGRVAGYAGTAAGDPHAFYWPNGGSLIDLGTLGGRTSFGTVIQFASGAGPLQGGVGGVAEGVDCRRAPGLLTDVRGRKPFLSG